MTPSDRALAGPSRPLGSREIPQWHLPATPGEGVYAPWLYGAARVHFSDRKRKLDETRRVAFHLPLGSATRTVIDWDLAEPIAVLPEDLLAEPAIRAPYLPLPKAAMDPRVFTRWARGFDRWVARTQRLPIGDGTGETLAPKRGGVSVELVAVVWQLG